jgi:hypothetical protein
MADQAKADSQGSMNENDKSTPANAHKRFQSIDAEATSGASLNQGHTLLPI